MYISMVLVLKLIKIATLLWKFMKFETASKTEINPSVTALTSLQNQALNHDLRSCIGININLPHGNNSDVRN